jgi:hypothetical protein
MTSLTQTNVITITSDEVDINTFTTLISTYLQSVIDTTTRKVDWKEKFVALQKEGFGTKQLNLNQLADIVHLNDNEDQSLVNIIITTCNTFPDINEKYAFKTDENNTDTIHMTEIMTPYLNIPITSNKNSIFDFTTFITKFLDNEINNMDNNEEYTWKEKWDNYKTEGFGNRKFTRFQLAKFILGTTELDKSLTNVINGIRNQFPPINDKLTFNQSKTDTDLWHLTNTINKIELSLLSSKQSPDIQKNEADEWTTMPVKRVSSHVPRENPETKPDIPTKNVNQFALLNVDADLSYDTSDESTKSKILDTPTSTDFSTTRDSNLPKVIPEEPSKIDSLTNKTKIYHEVEQAIKDKYIDELDTDKILYWVNTSINSISSTIEDRTNTSFAKINDHANDLIQDLENNISSIKTFTEDAKTNCDNAVKQSNKQVNTITRDLAKIETNAILHINTCANRRKAEIQGKIDELNNISLKITASAKLPSDCLDEVNKSIKLLRTSISNAYEQFEEDTNTIIDDQKQDLRQWIAASSPLPDTKVVNDINNELRKLKHERSLLESQRQEIDSWFQQIKNTTVPPSNVSSVKIEPGPQHKQPPFTADTAVRYTKGLCDVAGYIMNNTSPVYKDNKWHFEIFTMNGTTIHNCSEDHITAMHDVLPPPGSDPTILCTPPSPYFPPSPPRSAPIPTSFQQQTSNNWRPSRPLAANEFEYPLGSLPTSVNAQRLIKHAESWTYNLKSTLDLRGFYDQIQILLRPYSIYLKNYNEITANSGLEAIDIDTCKHYNIAQQQMSQGLMLYFQTHGQTIFSDYPEPLEYIAAFRASSNGLGFLKRLMKKRHPNLKDVINRKTPVAPQFKHHKNIYLFIQAYIEWIHDEDLRGGRKYDNKEKLDHILSNLDDRFNIAISKIEATVDKLYADPLHPLPFPPQLTLTSDLGIYITDLIPDDKKEDLTNTLPQIHAMTRHQYKKRDSNHTPRPTNPYNKTSFKEKTDVWADKLEWKVMPGMLCPACNKKDHNVYRTGCPALSIYSACKEFHDKTPKDKLDLVQRSYRQYQRDLAKKLKDRRNNDRRTLRLISSNYNDDDVGELKNLFFNKYKEDFQDEQYITDNPYDDYYVQESDEEQEDNLQ